MARHIDPKEIRGLISATITPFDEKGLIDLPTLKSHLARVSSTPGLYGVCVVFPQTCRHFS